MKPAEAEIEFALDLAWNVTQWPPEKAHLYIKHWAAETFGPEFAQQIADIKRDYYLLAQTGKPEHLDLITFSREEAQRRLEAYQRISKEATRAWPKNARSAERRLFSTDFISHVMRMPDE